MSDGTGEAQKVRRRSRRNVARQFTGLVGGNGISTALSFAASALLAAGLTPAGFGAINLCLVAGSLVGVAGGAVDSAAARIIARRSAPASGYNDAGNVEDIALRWRLMILLASFGLFAGLLVVSSTTDVVGWAASMVVFGSAALAISALNLALIRPQAHGRIRAYTIYQAAYFGTLLLLVAIAYATGSGVALTGMLVSLAALVAVILLIIERRRGQRMPVSRRRFRRIAGGLLLGGVLFAIFERAELLFIAVLGSATDTGVLGLALRVGGGLALVSGAFVMFALPRVSAVPSAHDLGDVYRDLMPALGLTVLACGGAALLLPTLVPLVFGPEYDDAGWVASIYIAQYPLVACYMPIAVAFTFFGRSRWQVELPALLLTVKAGGLLLVTPNLYLMAATAAVAHAVGVGYVAWRWKSMRAMHPVHVEGSGD